MDAGEYARTVHVMREVRNRVSAARSGAPASMPATAGAFASALTARARDTSDLFPGIKLF